MRSHAKRGNPTHSTRFTDRRGNARWPSSLGWTSPETRCGQRHPQSDEPGNTKCQTTRTSQEDIAPTDQGRHDGRGCYPGCGPRPEGVEKEDNNDSSLTLLRSYGSSIFLLSRNFGFICTFLIISS